jgi:hypothetical protein
MTDSLGRRVPSSWEHVDSYPLTATPTKPVPVTLGISWYTAFDSPERDSQGRWWVGRNQNLGTVRGGHSVCIPSGGTSGNEPTAWWGYYDQGSEGACVGYGSSRMMSLLNRSRYDAHWLYKQAQQVDEWPGDAYSGTSVRAAMDVLRTLGHSRVLGGVQERIGTDPRVRLEDGISENRWATHVDQIHQVIQSPTADRLGAVPFRNSWGRSYPKQVWLPDMVMQRLLSEDGEATLVSDR